MGRGNSVNGFWCAPFVSVSVRGTRDNGSMTSAAPFRLPPPRQALGRGAESKQRAHILRGCRSVDEKAERWVLNRIDSCNLWQRGISPFAGVVWA
ncbi:hypothetical protein TNIN_250581 [Trichonephila inaurata madagascariensis]|uniref:Uncharacterized protein n=1 Tax=Trichonephila inaurata madagascariensis TaxID=2747483 RepID=A0A8X6Y3W3_9ARAC|nr:hypothetical protein TNIN_484941 [Trichonephila inaurata madagascariensis]GFY64992.1 hypothetical protein TNIN_250581 [Trichonephila inaurata madagascariensis]